MLIVEQAPSIRRPSRVVLLASMYLLVITILGYVLLVAAANAPVIWKAEAEAGHPFTCYEAYQQRQIDTFFYSERRTQGDILYFFSLCAPAVVLGFAGLTIALGVILRRSGLVALFRRRLWPLLAVGTAICVALIAYLPVIATIGCALE